MEGPAEMRDVEITCQGHEEIAVGQGHYWPRRVGLWPELSNDDGQVLRRIFEQDFEVCFRIVDVRLVHNVSAAAGSDWVSYIVVEDTGPIARALHGDDV